MATRYKLAFSNLGAIPQAWFNFQKDVLFLSYHTFSYYSFEDEYYRVVNGIRGAVGMDKKDLDSVQNLVIR